MECTEGVDFKAERIFRRLATGTWRRSIRDAEKAAGSSRSLSVHGRTYGGGRQTVSDELRAGTAGGSSSEALIHPRPRIFIVRGAACPDFHFSSTERSFLSMQ